jgi:hypothetical protein
MDNLQDYYYFNLCMNPGEAMDQKIKILPGSPCFYIFLKNVMGSINFFCLFNFRYFCRTV